MPETFKPKEIKLRTATLDDLAFLYNVSISAMGPVSAILDKGREFDEASRFREYKENFHPEKIQVILSDQKEVGRLRVVRSGDEIYIGGIQILPEFQALGIGSGVFKDLIVEANNANKVIRLEVHKVNLKAIKFYEKLEFVVDSQTEKQLIMRYYPTPRSSE